MNTHSLYSVIIALLAAWTVAVNGVADVRMSPLVSDGMVLQRDRSLNISGWAEPGEKIELSLAGKKYSTSAGEDGRWTVRLEPMKAGGPYVMTVNTVEVNDVMVGDGTHRGEGYG